MQNFIFSSHITVLATAADKKLFSAKKYFSLSNILSLYKALRVEHCLGCGVCDNSGNSWFQGSGFSSIAIPVVIDKMSHRSFGMQSLVLQLHLSIFKNRINRLSCVTIRRIHIKMYYSKKVSRFWDFAKH